MMHWLVTERIVSPSTGTASSTGRQFAINYIHLARHPLANTFDPLLVFLFFSLPYYMDTVLWSDGYPAIVNMGRVVCVFMAKQSVIRTQRVQEMCPQDVHNSQSVPQRPH